MYNISMKAKQDNLGCETQAETCSKILHGLPSIAVREIATDPHVFKANASVNGAWVSLDVGDADTYQLAYSRARRILKKMRSDTQDCKECGGALHITSEGWQCKCCGTVTRYERAG